MLYMFQAVPLPIIRSSKTVYTALGTCQTFTAACHYRGRVGNTNSSTIAAGSSKGLTSTRCCIYSFWAPDDGQRYRLKHVEHFTEINKLCNVASCWLYLEILVYCINIAYSVDGPRMQQTVSRKWLTRVVNKVKTSYNCRRLFFSVI
jgi:hypothetical protein